MTFATSETGATTGRPVELYAFGFPFGSLYRTSYDEDFVSGGITYTSCVISHGAIENVPVEKVRELVITLPVSDPVVVALQNYGLSPRGIAVTIDRLHTTDSGATLRRKSQGEIAVFECRDEFATIHVHALLDKRLDVTLPIAQSQTLCNHMFGDNGCTAVAGFITTVANVVGTTISLTADGGNPDDWARDGAITRLADGESKSILAHIGNNLTIDVPFGALLIGDTVFVSAGCDHLVETCFEKFNNVINFGGHPELPENNPMAPTGYGVIAQT